MEPELARQEERLNRAETFGLLIAADLVAIVAFVVAYLFAGSPPGGFYGWMMGQMNGNGGPAGGATVAPGGSWVVLVVIVALGVLGVAGLAYSLAYPKIKQAPATPEPAPPSSSGAAEVSWDVLFRTSKEDERKVLGVLAAHGGGYLQKFVVKETGLSKLKTHRVVARLAERGVVMVEKSGNTNQVSLAPWVKGRPTPTAATDETRTVSSRA